MISVTTRLMPSKTRKDVVEGPGGLPKRAPRTTAVTHQPNMATRVRAFPTVCCHEFRGRVRVAPPQAPPSRGRFVPQLLTVLKSGPSRPFRKHVPSARERHYPSCPIRQGAYEGLARPDPVMKR